MKERCICLVFFLFMHFSTIASECKIIKAACTTDWYPVSFLLPKNQQKATGVAVEIARSAAKDLNLEIEFNCLIPWKRANNYMNTGKIDMLIGHYLNQQREQYWLVSDTLFKDDIRAAYMKEALQIKTIENLMYLTGAKPRGASFGTMIDKYISNSSGDYKVGEVTDKYALFGQLLKGRVDYILSAKRDIEAYSRTLGIDDKLKYSEPLTLNSIHFSFSKHSPCSQYYEQFNALIKEYKKSGLIDTLFIQAKNDFQKKQKIIFNY